jgi:hypothetical protein
MATIQEINSSIISGNFTNEQLDSVLSTIKYARSQLSRDIKRALAPGVKVSFVSNRNGQKYLGTVRKINIKYVIVDTAMGAYRVPANMLSPE